MNTKSYKISDNGIIRDMTADEKAEYDSRQIPVDLAAIKLSEIRKIRNKKLSETDYLGASDQTMSDAMKTRRQEWRDLPQNNTTEEQYDVLLETQGTAPNITFKHSIWDKPA